MFLLSSNNSWVLQLFGPWLHLRSHRSCSTHKFIPSLLGLLTLFLHLYFISCRKSRNIAKSLGSKVKSFFKSQHCPWEYFGKREQSSRRGHTEQQSANKHKSSWRNGFLMLHRFFWCFNIWTISHLLFTNKLWNQQSWKKEIKEMPAFRNLLLMITEKELSRLMMIILKILEGLKKILWICN